MVLHTRTEEPPRGRLTFYCRSDGQPWRILVDGTSIRFSPLQTTLLVLLARAAGEAVHRDDLTRDMEVDNPGLYKAVHAVRRKLGDADRVEQVGALYTRHGKSHGFAGYRLAGMRVEWIERSVSG